MSNTVDDTELIGKMLKVNLKAGTPQAYALGGEYKGILRLGSCEFMLLTYKSEDRFIPIENIAWIEPMKEN